MSKPTAEYLRSILRYDPESGLFTRRVSTSSNAREGDIAGSINGRGYLRISIDKKNQLVHRLAWLYMNGEWPENDIDHINGIKSDNRWVNLRAASRSENCWNQKKRVHNTSGFKGVTWSKAVDKWVAQITHNCKHYYLGCFDDPELAALAHAGAARILFGDFSHSTNIITINNFYGANENGK